LPRQGEERVNFVNNRILPLLLVGLLLAQVSFAATYPLTITPGRSWPLSVVADSSRGLVYFDATSGEYPPTGFSFGIINATTHDVIKVLPLDVYPGAMVLDQASGDVYVAGSTSIAVFSAANQAFVRNLTVGHPILSIEFDSSVSPDLYVTSGNSLLSLNPQTGAILGSASFPNNLDGVQLDPSNGRLFVGQYPGDVISVLNATDLATMGTVSLPGCCALQFALDVKAQSLYAATGTNYVFMVNAATDTFEKSIQVATSTQNSTNSIVVDNDTGRVYVASSPGGSILELDSAGTVVQHYTVQSEVAGLAVDTKTQELFASNYHQITVFDAGRPRTYLFVIGVAVVAVVVVAAVVYLVIRRRDERERMKVQMGWGKSPGQG
jgi:DNA-binding beta-propeller fold protein YncE